MKKKKSVSWQLLWEYFGKTDIHGYKYLGIQSWTYLERSIWFCNQILLISLASFLIIFSYVKFLQAPTVTSQLPKKLPVSDIPFPAAAICLGNRISKKMLIQFSREIFENRNRSTISIGETVEEIAESLLILGGMYDYNLDSDQAANILDVHNFLKDYYGTDAYPLSPISQNITPTCEEIMVRCRWRGTIVNCSEIFFVRRTFMGNCCCFNYQRFTKAQFNAFLMNNTKIPKPIPLIVNGSGPEAGLSVMINHNIEDYAYSLFSSISAKLLIYDPQEYPDAMSGSLNEIYLNPNEEIFASIHPEQQVGSKLMRDVTPQSRGCVFDDEKKLIFNEFYTHSECNLVCRLNHMISLCNCYTYISNIQMYNVSICYLDDLPCLIKWKESWFNQEPPLFTLNNMKVSFHCPDCVPTCDYINYKIQTSWGYLVNDRLQNRSYWPDFVMNVPPGNHTIAHIYYGSRSVYKSRQTIVDTWYDLLSYFGGICGLVMGASLVSLCELVYFGTGKFFDVFIVWRRERQREMESPTDTQLYWNEFKTYTTEKGRKRRKKPGRRDL